MSKVDEFKQFVLDAVHTSLVEAMRKYSTKEFTLRDLAEATERARSAVKALKEFVYEMETA